MEAVGAGADRQVVDAAGLAAREQLRAVFGRLDAGKRHCEIAREADVRRLQREAHGVGIELFHALDHPRQAQVLRVDEERRERAVERMVRVQKAAEGEQHIVGLELARRREVRRAVKAHAAPQMEGDAARIGRLLPAFSEQRLDRRAAVRKAEQALEHLAVDAAGGGRIPQPGVEPLGAGVGAVDQRPGPRLRRGQQQRGAQA